MDPLLPSKPECKTGCMNKLQTREDDKKEVIEVRMKEYADKTEPLLKEFEKKGVLLNFEIKKGVKDYPELKKQIDAKLSKIKWLALIRYQLEFMASFIKLTMYAWASPTKPYFSTNVRATSSTSSPASNFKTCVSLPKLTSNWILNNGWDYIVFCDKTETCRLCCWLSP